MRSGGRVSTLAFAGGVAFRVRFFEIRNRELRVVLRAVEVLEAEEFFHVPELRAAPDRLRGATGAEAG